MKLVIVIGAALVSVALLAAFVPPGLGVDYANAFRPAALAVLAGQSPYTVGYFLMPPWVLLPFVPLALLPYAWGYAILTVAGFAAYAWSAVRLGARPVGLAAILLSPMVIHGLLNGNIDWLVILGFVLPPRYGLFLLAVKPQIGAPLMVLWAFEAWRGKRLIATFAPFAVVLLLSFIPWGLWPSVMFGSFGTAPGWNTSLYPESLPFGMVLLLASVRRDWPRLAQGIGPLLSPHVMFHSWAACLYALAPNTVEVCAASAAAWLYVGIVAL